VSDTRPAWFVMAVIRNAVGDTNRLLRVIVLDLSPIGEHAVALGKDHNSKNGAVSRNGLCSFVPSGASASSHACGAL